LKITISAYKGIELAPGMVPKTRPQLLSMLRKMGFVVRRVEENRNCWNQTFWKVVVRCTNQDESGRGRVYSNGRPHFCAVRPCDPEGTPGWCGFKWRREVRKDG